MERLLESIASLSGKADREFADSVLEVSMEANKQVVKKLLGDDGMCQALLEMMEPHLQLRDKKIREEVRKEVREEDIQMTIEILREFGHRDSEIKGTIMKRYALSEEKAGAYM